MSFLDQYSLPLANAEHEKEAQHYAKQYNCSIEKARYDIEGEMEATETAVDAFYARD